MGRDREEQRRYKRGSHVDGTSSSQCGHHQCDDHDKAGYGPPSHHHASPRCFESPGRHQLQRCNQRESKRSNFTLRKHRNMRRQRTPERIHRHWSHKSHQMKRPYTPPSHP
jgi:hypothetical protein